MKKLLSLFFAFLMIVTCFLTGCQTTPDVPATDTDTSAAGGTTVETSAPVDSTRRDALKAAFLAKADEVIVSADSVTFTDASDTKKEIAKNPASAVGLYASLTTLWYEAGGTVAGCIGGSSSSALYVEHIGHDIAKDDGMTVVSTSSSGKKWDVETIIALQPSLIFCSTAMSGYATIQAPAEAAGIPVVAVTYDSFSDYLKWFKVFCNLSGRPELWDSIAMPVLDDVVDLLLAMPTEGMPRVFSMFSGSDSLQANTSNTVVGEMISAMHASNIADAQNENGAERIEINLEAVFAADPDIIVVQCHSDVDTAKQQVQETYGDNAVWNALRTVKEGRVYYLDKSLFHNKPNRRFGEAYRTLGEILFPGLADKDNK